MITIHKDNSQYLVSYSRDNFGFLVYQLKFIPMPILFIYLFIPKQISDVQHFPQKIRMLFTGGRRNNYDKV